MRTGSSSGAMFVAVAGDVDGDGVSDVYASDFSNSARGPLTGRVYVYSGATGKPVLVITGDRAGETLGASASKAGDVNGDGIEDFHITSAYSMVHGHRSGRVYIVAGARGTPTR